MLTQKGEHWTPEPVVIRLSPTGGVLFYVVKTFHANIDNIAKFGLIVKNSYAGKFYQRPR